ncbi:MAG: HlyD family efflux transporter periplasmic adaptor subunit [Planctomycetota bacterium]
MSVDSTSSETYGNQGHGSWAGPAVTVGSSTAPPQASSQPSPSQPSQSPTAKTSSFAASSFETVDENYAERRGYERNQRAFPSHWFEGLDYVSEDVVATVRQVVTDHAASDLRHWQDQPTENGEQRLVLLNSHEDDKPELTEKTRALVSECIESRQPVSKLFPLEDRYYVVAAPLPSNPGCAITIRYPFNRELDLVQEAETVNHIQLRCRDTSLVAAHLGCSRIKRLALQQLESAEQQLRDQIAEEHRAQPWKQIGGAVKQLCLGLVSNSRYMLLATLGILLLALIPFPFSIKCKVTCEPLTRRFVSAPFDAKLLESHVKAGEQVIAGQVLAELDGSDLQTQIANLQAKLSQSQQRHTAALASGDASEAELERLESAQLRGEIRILESRFDRLQIVAPIDGIVVAGNLERSEGSTLTMGDSLFEVAPIDDMIAEIAIPEDQIAYVKPELSARINLNSQGGQTLQSKLETIHPRNEMLNGQSVFIAEAPLANQYAALLPGMTGNARIHAGYQPVGWILFHRPYEKLRQLIGW